VSRRMLKQLWDSFPRYAVCATFLLEAAIMLGAAVWDAAHARARMAGLDALSALMFVGAAALCWHLLKWVEELTKKWLGGHK